MIVKGLILMWSCSTDILMDPLSLIVFKIESEIKFLRVKALEVIIGLPNLSDRVRKKAMAAFFKMPISYTRGSKGAI